MKKIEFKKKAYQKPEVLDIIYIEEELMQHLSQWDNDGDNGGGIMPDPDGGDGDDFGGGT